MLVSDIERLLFCGYSFESLGPDRFDEAMDYVGKHRLYDLALSIWEGTVNYKVSPMRC